MKNRVLSPGESVLYNQDLLTIICDDLWTPPVQKLHPAGTHIHPLVALASTCSAVSEMALNRLWEYIDGLNPLFDVFKYSSYAGTADPPGIYRVIPEKRPKKSGRVHPTTYLRIVAQFPNVPIFPNLNSITVDESIAAEPRILFLLPSPKLQKVELSVGLDADNPTVFTAVNAAITGRKTFIVSCPTIATMSHPVDVTAPCDAALFTGKSLRLKILNYRVVDAFLEELSSSESLEHLQITFSPWWRKDIRAGFRSLKSFHVTGPVASMNRVLRLIVPGKLESFTLIDNTSGQGYQSTSQAMRVFHRDLLARFGSSMRELSLTYPSWSIERVDWNISQEVFEPFFGLTSLKKLHYTGEIALDRDLFHERLVTAWPDIEMLNIPRIVGPALPFDVLPVIALNFPRLTHLTLPVSFPESYVAPHDQILQHGLRTLASPDASVGRHACVARYLDRIFPFLTRVEGGEGWDQVERIILDACQPIRRDHQGRQGGVSS
ncbi:uncharacterized protein EV420DRAFT_1647758 [Desarmillaria tabescens]|uniref:Uncharacterized protein n=1 Tax=Armillaria tabescens TaxID=1929756 RepID=A0AA39JRG6_ARMTA|nr:uncharacterized protein EV420DRAFT_1647758 [Desarmillaria tabescens]KAK0447428.1 hypothetical protein EV420DRAFT_1647758 [Desarmillaria tabescens]